MAALLRISTYTELAASTKPFIIRNYSRAVASDVFLSYQYKKLSLSLSQSVQWIALCSHLPCKLKGKNYKYVQKRLPPGQNRGDFMLYLLGWTFCQEYCSCFQEMAQFYELSLNEILLGQVLIPPRTINPGR